MTRCAYVAALQWSHPGATGGNRKEYIMKRIHKILAGAVGALTLVVAATVMAAPGGQFGGCDGAGPGAAGPGRMGWMHGGMGPGGHGGMWGGGPGVMSEQYLAQMKTQLAISPKQESAWQAFAAKAAEQASLMQATREQHWQATSADTTAPARMALQIGYMTRHLAGMQAVNATLTDLYAVLTPEQRSLADQYFGHIGQRGFGRGMRG
jgi:hypothetical protein